jgi:hypothetical protein
VTAGNQVLLRFGRRGWNKVQHSLIELHGTSDVIEIKCLLESDEFASIWNECYPCASYSSNRTDGGILFLTIKDSHCM